LCSCSTLRLRPSCSRFYPKRRRSAFSKNFSPEVAADIVEELPGGGIGADFLREIHRSESEAVLAEFDDPDEAEHPRERYAYAWDTAGGLMNESFASFPGGATIGDVLTELGEHADRYGDMDVQYVYFVNGEGHLRGVIRLRDLVLTARNRPVAGIMIGSPVSVRVSHDFDKLRGIFEKRDCIGLPIVSGMSGCSGNQAVAVSIRELTLGLIKPHGYMRIVWKEGVLGLVLGAILGVIAALWKSNVYLGLVLGGSLALNTVLSALLGGCVPPLLKRLKVDPALASGPILTTCTDMCGFFLVLNLATALLSRLT